MSKPSLEATVDTDPAADSTRAKSKSPREPPSTPPVKSEPDASSPTEPNMVLSGDCETVQRKGSQYLKQMTRDAEARGPSICPSAKDAKRGGEIAVKVAEACQNIPTWKSMRDIGRRQIREAQATIARSCGGITDR